MDPLEGIGQVVRMLMWAAWLGAAAYLPACLIEAVRASDEASASNWKRRACLVSLLRAFSCRSCAGNQ